MMKKSLVAVAVMAVSGMASAQSTVTIYGLIDAYFGSVKSGTLTQTVVNSGGLQSSRFGFKGTEDLGGGLKANFVLEAGFNVDTGASRAYDNPYTAAATQAMFGRQAFVGLSGGFGEVKLGKMWTPFDEVKGSGAAGFDANVFAPATNVWSSNSYSDLPGNAIYYSTPNFSGFSAAVMHSFGENKTATVGAGSISSMNVAYSAGPLAAALSYQTQKATGAVAATKFTQLNGSYDLGVVKLLGAYGTTKNQSSPVTTLAQEKTKEYQLGLDFPVSSTFTLSGGYARSKGTRAAGASELKRTGYGIAGLYAMSKRTNLYAGYQNAKETAAGLADRKDSTVGVGVRHTF